MRLLVRETFAFVPFSVSSRYIFFLHSLLCSVCLPYGSLVKCFSIRLDRFEMILFHKHYDGHWWHSISSCSRIYPTKWLLFMAGDVRKYEKNYMPLWLYLTWDRMPYLLVTMSHHVKIFTPFHREYMGKMSEFIKSSWELLEKPWKSIDFSVKTICVSFVDYSS